MNYPFLFARKERKGLYVLLFLSVVFIVGKFYFFPAPAAIVGNSQLTKPIEKMSRVYTTPTNYFDPNQLNASQWLALGLDEKVAARIEKYVSKGGHFYEAKDLLKMYGMDTAFYKKIESKIQIAAKEKKENKFEKKAWISNYNPSQKKVKPIVEINGATQEQLIEIDGVGEKLASRIIKYRDLLGGFIRKEQLRKVYGMDSLNYAKIQNQISVDLTLVKRVDVNKASMEELSKLKSVGIKRAKAIVAYRQEHGDFSSLKDLLKTQVISDSILYLIEPYILLK
jgi:competence protein ComEA